MCFFFVFFFWGGAACATFPYFCFYMFWAWCSKYTYKVSCRSLLATITIGESWKGRIENNTCRRGRSYFFVVCPVHICFEGWKNVLTCYLFFWLFLLKVWSVCVVMFLACDGHLYLQSKWPLFNALKKASLAGGFLLFNFASVNSFNPSQDLKPMVG